MAGEGGGDEANAGPDAPRPLTWTTSVRGIAQQRQPMTALAVARQLWQDHPDYPGRREALDLLAHFQPAQLTHTGSEWVSAVEAVLDRQAIEAIPEEQDRVLHGKLLLYGLAAIEEQLRGALDQAGLLAVLRRGITPDPESLLIRGIGQPVDATPASSASSPTTAATSPDAKIVGDAPATVDLLDREGFANALSELLRQQRRLTGFGEGTILVQMFGAWGAGKTSVARFVQVALEQPRKVGGASAAEQPWLFVEFDAWKHQRTAPPWWWLMDAVYRRGRSRQPGSPADLDARHRRSLWWWRWGWACLAFAVAALLVILVVVVHAISLDLVTQAQRSIAAVVGLVGAIGGLYALYRSARTSLLVGSPRAAKALLQSGGDPLRRMRSRFLSLVRRVGRPVIVFIDNLDRCQPTYVVELLEGIQTIFGDAHVTYLVAADREWVAQCFQEEYKALGPVMGRPGRPLGYLFLEKIFALSAPLPRPSAQARERYWEAVLRQGESPFEEVTSTDRAAATQHVASQTVAGVLHEVKQLDPSDGSAKARALREAAAVKVVDATIGGEQDHELAPYLALMEDNPRSLKRLRNAVSLARAGRLTGGDVLTEPTDLDGLIRWTILTLRWPALGVVLTERPELAVGLVDPTGDGFSDDLKAATQDQALERLLTTSVGGVAPDLPAWLAKQYGPGQLPSSVQT